MRKKNKNCVFIQNVDLSEQISNIPCKKIVNLDPQDSLIQAMILKPSTLIIATHGEFYNGEHNLVHQRIGTPTKDYIAKIANGRPVQVLLASCHSGTNPESLLSGLAKGSAIITTSAPNQTITTKTSTQIIKTVLASDLDFKTAIANNLPVFASTNAKYTTHEGIFDFNPPTSIFESRENSREYLLQASKNFNNFIGRNITKLTYEDSEVDLFVALHFLEMLNRESQVMNDILKHKDSGLYLLQTLHNNELESLFTYQLFKTNNIIALKLLLELGMSTSLKMCSGAVSYHNNEALTLLLDKTDLDQASLVELFRYTLDKSNDEVLTLLLDKRDLDQANLVELFRYALVKGNNEALAILLDKRDLDQASLVELFKYAMISDKISSQIIKTILDHITSTTLNMYTVAVITGNNEALTVLLNKENLDQDSLVELFSYAMVSDKTDTQIIETILDHITSTTLNMYSTALLTPNIAGLTMLLQKDIFGAFNIFSASPTPEADNIDTPAMLEQQDQELSGNSAEYD